ncbi:MAG TPA: DUF3352 domain-containing protein, partial [Phototrophicaceae bacterium]|nr:DUF3352 domain-containing protein [Phototrophicaceae bacterium]
MMQKRLMRRFLQGFVLAALLTALSVAGITAAPADNGVLSMAQYFPAETPLLYTMRTDEAYIDDLDQLLKATVGSAPLPSDVSIPTLRQALEEVLGQGDVTLDQIYAWLGDTVAVGITSIEPDGGQAKGYFVQQITDSAALETFITSLMAAHNVEVETTTEGDYTVLTAPSPDTNDLTKILIGDDLAIILSPGTDTPAFPLASSLLDSDKYQKATASLPADSYDIAFYIDPSSYITPPQLDELSIFGINASTFLPVMIGFTRLDQYSLVIDVAQTGNGTPSDAARIDPDFLKYIPADSSAVIHASDISGLVNQGLALMAKAAKQTGTDTDPVDQIEMTFSSLGFDLQNDILSWTTGDYALFLRTNIRPIIEGAVKNEVNIAGNFDAGLVIEATDPAKAKTFAAKLGTLLSAMLGKQEGLTITQDTLEGVAVTSITASGELSPGQTLSLTVVIGASDDIFFIATKDAASAILRGEGGLDQSKAYQQ